MISDCGVDIVSTRNLVRAGRILASLYESTQLSQMFILFETLAEEAAHFNSAIFINSGPKEGCSSYESLTIVSSSPDWKNIKLILFAIV